MKVFVKLLVLAILVNIFIGCANSSFHRRPDKQLTAADTTGTSTLYPIVVFNDSRYQKRVILKKWMGLGDISFDLNPGEVKIVIVPLGRWRVLFGALNINSTFRSSNGLSEATKLLHVRRIPFVQFENHDRLYHGRIRLHD